jgi:hypothetical protein
MSNRPTFYTNNNEPIRAGGIIFYKRDKLTGDIKILLQYSKNKYEDSENKYEDIGGKTDIGDKDIYDTIIRETIEETNNVITKEIINNYLDKQYDYIYIPNSKYMLLLIEADNDIINIDRRQFGKVEKLTGKIRQFQWIDYNRLKYSKIPFNERIWIIHNKLYNYFFNL